MTTPTVEWITEMANLIKERDHALNMVRRWQDKVDAAEAGIQALRDGNVEQALDGDPQTPEQPLEQQPNQ